MSKLDQYKLKNTLQLQNQHIVAVITVNIQNNINIDYQTLKQT